MKSIKLKVWFVVGGFLLLLSSNLQAGSVTYAYDNLGRLSTVTYPNGVVITYLYDASGNRTGYTVTGLAASD
jgi:YD repeat-containing protein